jgi:DNA-directed RNA polymerase specialized sigma24 family protein
MSVSGGHQAKQDELYEQSVSGYGKALERLARAYEANPDKRRDLIQEIDVALWLSFEKFDDAPSRPGVIVSPTIRPRL